LSIAEEAVQVGRRRGAPDYEALALLARASILLDTTGASGGDEIEACLDRVREIVAREGATAYLGLVHLHLGQLAELRGDAQGAAAALDVAQRHFAAMGARGWVEEVEQRRRREVAA
jgi:hypothetical protein